METLFLSHSSWCPWQLKITITITITVLLNITFLLFKHSYLDQQKERIFSGSVDSLVLVEKAQKLSPSGPSCQELASHLLPISTALKAKGAGETGTILGPPPTLPT